jgi:serine/threonine-protein kinase
VKFSSDRRRVLELYHQALGRDAEGRSAFLRGAAAGDEELYRNVEAMLALEPPSDFLGPSTETDDELIGKQVGLYRVESRLGSGGMGQVFRAHDTRLGRDVALKILPRTFATDAERRSRFEREARLLATLNHPHIAAIYGVEEVDGVPALVLELVDGVTLANHLKRSHTSSGRGLPVSEALQIAQQIAEALEAAHERGIVHRDLKPTNILLTEAGSVKVLDFGLAKAMSAADSGPNATDTRAGIVMGTPAYMSPEQAKGLKVDRRTDVWAFGCVLFEILAGRPVFSGDSIPETLTAVLHAPPDWSALPGDVPAPVRMVLEGCLRKDPAVRLRDIGDVRLAMSGAFNVPARSPEASVATLGAASSPRHWWRRAGPVSVAFGAGALAAAAVFLIRDAPNTTAPVTRLPLGARGAAALHVEGNDHELAITPDGSRVVYVGNGGRQIFVRALDHLDPVAIASGSLLKNPFISPDGQWVGFGESFRAGSLNKVPISGGPVVEIATGTGTLRGAVWLADNTIVFASSNRTTGLRRVSAGGGTPHDLTRPDPASNEYDHFWPEALPDGRGIVYTVLARTGGLGAARTVIYDLETRTSTNLLTGAANAVYLRSGHLAYVAGEPCGPFHSMPVGAQSPGRQRPA